MYLFRLISMLGGLLSPPPYWIKFLGRKGEYLVLRYFRRRGYYLVARNARLGKSELDLILCNGREILIVEVKTRTRTASQQRLSEAVSYKQTNRIKKAGTQFLKKKGWTAFPAHYVVAQVLVDKKINRTLFKTPTIRVGKL